ncbi:MAG: hypothetical protein IH623_03200 [Verrucomicrobia bacterium]|nr:hypothetical protein [Verrucomicrobiota bacterium]
MITDDMIHGRIAGPPRRRIHNDTPIVPRAVAETVWEEATVYLQTELPRAWVRRLAVRAQMAYHRNAQFRRLLHQNGDAGRDWLWAFMRHWLAARLRAHRHDLYARLPASFSVGGDLPERPPRTR